nr:inward rectifier potassium channel 4 isoform X1 [Equus asinus]
MGSGRSAPPGRRKTRAGSGAGAGPRSPQPLPLPLPRPTGRWQGVAARLGRGTRAGQGPRAPGAPGLGRSLRSGARVTCEEGRKSGKAGGGRRVGSSRRAAGGGSSGSRASRGRGGGAWVRDSGAAPRVGGREGQRRAGRQRETRKGDRPGRGRGRQGRDPEGDGDGDPAGRDGDTGRETETGRGAEARGQARQVAAEPGPPAEGSRGGRRAQPARERSAGRGTARSDSEGTAEGGGGQAPAGGRGARAPWAPGAPRSEPGRAHDADAQAAPRARRGSALKVGRPAGSGAGRPRGAGTRRPADRAAGGGGAGPPSSRGGGAGTPLSPPGRRPPDRAVGCSARSPPPGHSSDPPPRGELIHSHSPKHHPGGRDLTCLTPPGSQDLASVGCLRLDTPRPQHTRTCSDPGSRSSFSVPPLPDPDTLPPSPTSRAPPPCGLFVHNKCPWAAPSHHHCQPGRSGSPLTGLHCAPHGVLTHLSQCALHTRTEEASEARQGQGVPLGPS